MNIYLLHQIDIHCIDVAIEQFFGFESCFFIIASFDFIRVNFIVETTRLAPCESQTKWSYMRIKRCLPKSVATDRTAKANNQRHIIFFNILVVNYKYNPSIRLNLRYPYYFVISWLSSPYDETTPNLRLLPEIEAKCFLAHSIFDFSTLRRFVDLTTKSDLPFVSAMK